MKPLQGYKASLSALLLLWYIAFFTGLIFHFRAVSSISTGLLLLTGVLYNKALTGSLVNKKMLNPVLISCLVYFLYVSAIVLLKDDTKTAQRHIELTSALVLVPAALFCCSFLNTERIKLLMKYYILLLAAACLYCFIVSFAGYLNNSDVSQLFYHELVSPLKQHAVYFSLLVLFGIAYLLTNSAKGEFLLNKSLHFTSIVFFSVFLILLSSKLVLLFYGMFLISFFLFISKKKKKLLLPALLLTGAGVLIFTTNNPVNKRFREVFQGDITIVKNDKYSPADYFNGLQFRLLQWRLVPEILNENKSWPAGLGEGGGQEKLKEKYIAMNMYQGRPGTDDTGYLAYNTHNQLLQSLLTGGMAGAFLFLLVCFSLFFTAWKEKNLLFSVSVLMVFMFSMTEACFETQYGLVIFIFFPLLFQNNATKNNPAAINPDKEY